MEFDAATATWVDASQKKPRTAEAQQSKAQRRQADRKKMTGKFAAKQSDMLAKMYASPEEAAELLWSTFTAEVGAEISEEENTALALTASQMIVGGARSDPPNLKAFLDDVQEAVLPATFHTAPKSKGSPRVLVLCQTARRAVELCKIISPICTLLKGEGEGGGRGCSRGVMVSDWLRRAAMDAANSTHASPGHPPFITPPPSLSLSLSTNHLTQCALPCTAGGARTTQVKQGSKGRSGNCLGSTSK
jgi:hypothetical protein